MSNLTSDLYPFLGLVTLFFVTVALLYIMYKRFEVAIFFFLLSPWIFSVFFKNYPEWINYELQTGINGYLRGGLLLALGIIGLVQFITTFPKHRGKISLHLILLGIFLLFSFFSFIYSIDPRYTIIRSGLFISVFSFLIGLNTWLDTPGNLEKAMRTAYYFVIFMIVINFLALIFWHSRVWWWKTPSRFLGLWDHPNSMGGFCMLAYPVLLFQIEKSSSQGKIIAFLFFLITVLLHLLTGSRTTILASIFGASLWLLISKKWTKLIYLTLIVSVLFFAAIQLMPSNLKRGDSKGIGTLTERQDLWKGSFLLMQQKLLTGYGYGVEAKIFANQKMVDIGEEFFIASAQQPLHNGFLSIIVGGGLFALILWLFILGIPIFIAAKSPPSPYRTFVLTVFLIVLLTNITENSLTGYLALTDMFFWFAWIIAGKLSDNSLTESQKDYFNDEDYSLIFDEGL